MTNIIPASTSDAVRADLPSHEPLPGAQYSSGVWYVNDTQVVTGQERVHSGDIIINGGGNLTLVDTVLRMNCTVTSNGYWIEVMPGGQLNIWDADGDPDTDDGSLVTDSALDTDDWGLLDYRYYFRVHDGAELNVNCSALEECGWYDQGEHMSTWGMYVQGDGAVVRNTTFSDCGAGIILNGSSGSLIDGMNASRLEAAVYGENANGTEVRNSWLNGTGLDYGIVFHESEGVRIHHNSNISVGYEGILLRAVNDSVVARNFVTKSTQMGGYESLDAYRCHRLIIRDNNVTAARNVMVLEECSNSTVEGPVFMATSVLRGINYVIKVDDSENITIEGARFYRHNYDITGPALYIWRSKDVDILNCSIEETNQHGIYLYQSNDFLVDNCTLFNCSASGSYRGLLASWCEGGTISNCTINGSSYMDISLAPSNGVRIVNNDIGATTATDYGVYTTGDDNFIAHNRFYHSDSRGIQVNNGDRNVIFNNTMQGLSNNGEGISVSGQDNLVLNCTIADYYWGLRVGAGSAARNVNSSSGGIGVTLSGGMLENVSSYQNSFYGLEVVGAGNVAMNCSFTQSAQKDLNINPNANASLINCTFDELKVAMFNPSVFYRKWWADILVNDTNGFVPGALVSVYNNLSALEAQGITGPDGRILLPVTQNRVYYDGSAHVESWNNHSISAFLWPDTAWVDPAPNVVGNTNYTITFSTDTNPAPPYDVSATAEGGDVNVIWDYPDLPDLKRFEVFCSEDPNDFNMGTPLGTSPGTQRFYVDAGGASDWKTYHYVVRAVDDGEQAGNVSESAMCGDWVVGNGVSASTSDRTILLNGSLTVEEGGSLSLAKVRLAFNNSAPGGGGITVAGVLEVRDLDDDPATGADASNISAADGDSPIYFYVEETGLLYMNNSVVWGIGYDVGAPIEHRSLVISGGDSVIRGCDIFPTVSTNIGMSVGLADGVQLLDNRILGANAEGIALVLSNNCTVSGNIVNATGETGITVFGGGNCTVFGNSVTNCSAGIGLSYASDAVVSENYVRDSSAVGLAVADSKRVDVLNNSVGGQTNKAGISLTNSPECTVGNNTADENKWGLTLKNCPDALVFGNTVTENSEVGMELGSCYNLVSSGNEVYDNTVTGIKITRAATVHILGGGGPAPAGGPPGPDPAGVNNKFTGDTVTGNTYGVHILGAEGVVMHGTNVTGNVVGMYLDGSGLIDAVDCNISGSLNYGARLGSEQTPSAYSYNLRLENCTLAENIGADLDLDDNMHVRCVNTSIPHDAINFNDGGSKVSYHWYIDVRVLDQFGDPAVNASVAVSNSLVTNVPAGSTGGAGYLRWLIIHERTALSSGNITYNPTTFEAVLGNHSGENLTTIAGPATINITLVNDPPTVLGLSILPLAPYTTEDINISFGYDDDEGDPEFPALIKWFCNGIEVPALENETEVPAGMTEKEETWFARVWVYDGADYSDPDDTDVITILNTKPVASDVLLSPGSVSSTGDIGVSYNYSDVDGDNEGDTLVRWYKDEGSGFADAGVTGEVLSHIHTAKGEVWMVKVQPHDGEDYGDAVDSDNTITIGNSPPSLTGEPAIEPEAPSSTDDITVGYSYSDPDGDKESGSLYTWYVDRMDGLGFVDSSLTGASVDAQYLIKGQMWKVRVTPSDGTDDGEPVVSDPVTIGNTAPEVTGNITFLPAEPRTADNIRVQYGFFDADGDADLGTSFRWYVKQPGGDETFVYSGIVGSIVPSAYTSKGQSWKVEITPSDGTSPGAPVLSPVSVNVMNSPPSVSKLVIEPTDARGGEPLTALYEFQDDDGDAEDGSSIKWFRDGVHVSAYDDAIELPAGSTLKGETWYFTVLPSDGTVSGTEVESPHLKVSGNVTILNTPPVIERVVITPMTPTTVDDLVVTYNGSDADGDDLSEIDIEWYRDNLHVEGFDGLETLDSGLTTRGELWGCRVRLFDGEDYSEFEKSNTVLVENSLPVATASPEPGDVEVLEGRSQVFNITAVDIDGDHLSIFWDLGGNLSLESAVSGQLVDYVFTPGLDDQGRYSLEARISDSSGDFLIVSWNITVIDINREPVIDTFGPEVGEVQVTQGKSVEFSVGAHDPDAQDDLTYTWYLDDEVAGAGPEYVVDTELLGTGTHTVSVSVSDGETETTHSWDLEVEEPDLGDRLLGMSYDWWGLILAVVSGIVTVLITIIGFIRLSRKKGKLRKYLLEIEEIRSSELKPQQKERRLQKKAADIKEEFSAGQIEENHYIILERACDDAMRQARKETFTAGFAISRALQAKVDDVLEDGVVTEEEYLALKRKIASDEGLSPQQKRDLNRVLARWAGEDKDAALGPTTPLPGQEAGPEDADPGPEGPALEEGPDMDEGGETGEEGGDIDDDG